MENICARAHQNDIQTLEGIADAVQLPFHIVGPNPLAICLMAEIEPNSI